MYIRTNRESTTRLRVPDITEEPIEFSDGRARVTADVGRKLARQFESITIERDESTSRED